MHFLMFIVVGFDIPILRQIIGFIYLSLVPGFVLLRILKLKRMNAIDTILLSSGLSIAFLMFIGLFMNELFPLAGFSKPLSTLPLLVVIGTITLTMSVISYCKDKNFSSSPLTISTKFVPQALLLTCVPVLAISGAWLANSYVLTFVVTVIAVLTVLLTILSKRSVHTELYSIAVLVIAVSLLFQRSLICNNLLGYDIYPEYYIFKLTKSNSFWSASILFKDNPLTNYNTMLSITVFPTIYSSLLNVQEEWIFKILYPLVFSFVPLTLYRTWRQQTGTFIGFLSAFIFMFDFRFLTVSEMRQIVGEFFFALLIFLMINRKINPEKRRILFIVFGCALVVSHYSLSYIFLSFIFFTWFFIALMKKNVKADSRTISGSLVLLLTIFTFCWYTFVSNAPTKSLLNFVNTVYNSFLTDFLIPESRGMSVYMSIHPLSFGSVLYKISNALPKILYVWLFIGLAEFFWFRTKYKEIVFEWEHALMVIANAILMALVILLPSFGPSWISERFFHVVLFFLAPFYVLGGETFFRWIQRLHIGKSKPLSKNKQLSLVCIVLVVIFLFKVGFIYEVAGDIPTSIPLSMRRMKMTNVIEIKATFYDEYTPEQDVSSAIWLSKTTGEEVNIYADDIAEWHVLIGYGEKLPEKIYPLFNDTRIEKGAYIYLRYINVVDGIVRNKGHYACMQSSNITELLNLLNERSNKIYSNSYSEIYR